MGLSDLFGGKQEVPEDGCENAAKVASKYGYQIVCEEEKEEEVHVIDPNCEHAKQVGSKYGYTIACDEEA